MSKRKLNLIQQRRIAHKQQAMDGLPGTVIANFGKEAEVATAKGNLIMCRKRQHLGPIVAGDKITWQPDKDESRGVIVAVQERSSLLSRPNARGQLMAVAANITRIFVVIAPVPAPQRTTIDRYLVTAEILGIEPILILNKEDLLQTASNIAPEQNQLLQLFQAYKDLGYKTISLSATQKSHIEELKTELHNHTSVFVGQSGVGKSSLISALIPTANAQSGEISAKAELGTHTTTTARLYNLDDNARIIDSPGIREFPLWPVSATELATGFREFREYLTECKFRNCRHVKEKDCAIQNAVAHNEIAQARYHSYQAILAEFEENKS